MITEITPTIEQQTKALEEKLYRLDKELEALHLVADPLNARIKRVEHVKRFLLEALAAIGHLQRAVKSAQDDANEPIPF